MKRQLIYDEFVIPITLIAAPNRMWLILLTGLKGLPMLLTKKGDLIDGMKIALGKVFSLSV